MKVVTFGEIMLRLQPENNLRFMQEKRFEATFGGSEANVAVCLSNFGIDSDFVTKLPKNDISKACVNELRGFGVGVDNISYGGDRMGLYYIEKGASMRGSKVIYDRAHSSISEAIENDFDIDKILNGASWFHVSGITPALSKDASNIVLKFVKACKERGITVSCDFNYRSTLWSKEDCGKVMNEILKYVDICIGVGTFEANEILGIDGDDFETIAKNLVNKFGCKVVVSNYRECNSYEDNVIWAKMYDGKTYTSKEQKLFVVDRVGGGDSFVAGLIYGFLNNLDRQKTIDLAIASSAIKHTIEGDFNRATLDEVMAIADGNSYGRVKR